MSDEKIIRFPGGDRTTPGAGGSKRAPAAATPVPPPGPIDPTALSPDQQKALGVILSGMAFVCVGIKPTASGADFFTALHGEPADLRNAQPHLERVIGNAYTRKGL